MDEPARPRRLSFTGGAGWTALLVLLMMLVIGITAGLREGAGDDIVNLTGCWALVHFTVIFLLVRVYRPDDRLRDALGIRPVNPLHVLLAAGFGAGLYPLLARLDDRFADAFPLDDDTVQSLERIYHPPTVAGKVTLFVCAALVIPACEELFFRGALFGALVQRRRDQERRLPLVMFASAGYFAFAQADLRALASSFFLGLALAWLRARSGSTFLAIVAHVSHLAIPFGPLLHGGGLRDDASFGTRWVIGGAVTLLVSAALLTLAFGKSKVVAAARARDAADSDAPDDDG